MGQAESNVTSGVKKQAGASMQALYKFVNLKGGGLLVDMMKRASQSKQYAEIDHAIKTKVEPFLYNKGAGRYIPISQLVLFRNRERSRTKQLPGVRELENPDEDFDVDKNWPDVSEEEYQRNPKGYKLVVWNIKERGAVGETILHLCLLNATALHADLAKRLLRYYPKLINDIYMCDEYWGENVLHIAIVNEDPSMVKYLLDSGADVTERCCGNFMCPEDQKASRFDTLDNEMVNVTPITDYDGYVYWGEYPLCFAACLSQEECFRLVLAKGADPDNQDTNGNTVLHMLVIYEKVSTFDMAYEMGGSIGIRNVQNLSPLTLAAKLARVEMFFHILNIEREIYWQLGSITCAAYPLEQIDTIDVNTGQISKDSALNLVAFGDKLEHLDLLDGVLIDLLKTKWNKFVKDKFYKQFYKFSIYFLVSLVGFTLRPNFDEHDDDDGGNSTAVTTTMMPMNETLEPIASALSYWYNITEEIEHTEEEVDGYAHHLWQSECPLLKVDTLSQQMRLLSEVCMFFGAISYIVVALLEARFLGYKMFVENLSTAPSRVMFLFSCILLMTCPFIKFFCLVELEDHMAVAIMITTAPYFLFFCRGFKTVGPFVVMIYRMVIGDLLRFVCIYFIFVMGFSQAYYIIFCTFSSPTGEEGDDGVTEEVEEVVNPMPSGMESFVAMFLMSLTNFGDYYAGLEHTEHEMEAKILFVLFMSVVAVLLVNLLIAMMGNTYTMIAEIKNEWQRQWARIVLVVERGVPPHERLKNLQQYSEPMSDGRPALILRLNMTDDDKEEMKEILEMKRVHERMHKKREVERELRRVNAENLRMKYAKT